MKPTNRHPIRLARIGPTHEANTFAPGPVRLDDFRRARILGGETLTRRHADAVAILGGYLRFALLASYKALVDCLVAADTDGVMTASHDRLPHRRPPLFSCEKGFIPSFLEQEP